MNAAAASESSSTSVFRLCLRALAVTALAQIAAAAWWFGSRLKFEDPAHRFASASDVEIVGSSAPTPDEVMNAWENEIVGGGSLPPAVRNDAPAPWTPPVFPADSSAGAMSIEPGRAADTPSRTSESGPPLDDEIAVRLLNDGLAFRQAGDMHGALTQFRAALGRLPDHPRLFYEIARTYEMMSLPDKANDYWSELYFMGEAKAGELFTVASMKLSGGDAGQTPGAPVSPLRIADVRVVPDVSVAEGQRLALQIALRREAGAAVDSQKVDVHVFFFDLVDGQRIDQSAADPPESRWLTGPAIDWGGESQETLEVIYRLPPFTPAEAASLGRREFFGYVVNVYYGDQLADQAAEPRTLIDFMDPSAAPPGPDGALFGR